MTDEGETVNWAALADAINGRMHELGMTQRELADRSGVSVATIRQIQSAQPASRRSPRTLADLSRAVGLPDGYLQDVLRFGTPASHQESPAGDPVGVLAAKLDQLAERVAKLESAKRTQ
jgi:transcriptional regulator with XRE-family HTH domain